MNCANCDGHGWVCEEHPEVPFDGNDNCCGGAGMPCTCNPVYTIDKQSNIIEQLESRIDVLKKALRFYADSSKWQDVNPDMKGGYYLEGEGVWYTDKETTLIICEAGDKARTALREAFPNEKPKDHDYSPLD